MGKGEGGRRLKTAFIPGAGLGERLRPLTETCPKPLLDLGGRPVVTYAMDHLISIGVERFVINTHHCPEVYLEKFPNRRWRDREILFRHEPRLLDTAGGLKNIEDLLESDEAILCYNGDIFTDLPLDRLVHFHNTRRPDATLVLRTTGPVLNVAFDGKETVCDIRNELGNSSSVQCLFTGVYAVETSLLKYIESGKVESIVTVFLERIRRCRESIAGIVIDDGYWCDIGSPETYGMLKIRVAAEDPK